MSSKLLLLCAIYAIIQLSYGSGSFPNYYRKIKNIPVDEGDLGEPLILTSYIRSGRIEEARKAAKVDHEDFMNVTHYSGFLTVNETYNSNLFFWFCPSEHQQSDPVVLWLQGGPGSTSLFGLFTENGPFEMNNTDKVILRRQRWSKRNHMLYIDNPAGTGYSFTKSQGLARDQEQIGRELFEALSQFFELFPELRRNDFFIAGESYAGHYIPTISYKILQENRLLPENKEINLKGIAIGNGWTDPINQLNYGEYLYQHGFIDLITKQKIDFHMTKAEILVKEREYIPAKNEMDQILSIFREESGYTNVYNYLYPFEDYDESPMDSFIQRTDIRKAIHVGNAKFNDGSEVYEALSADIMKSVVHLLPELIDNYRVLLYDGQADVIVAYPLMVNYLEKLNFTHAKEYKYGTRSPWMVGNDIAGFVKVAGNLTDLLVRNAGHMVPSDQPDWAYDLIYKFTRNLSFKTV